MTGEREVRPTQAGSLLRFDEAHLRVGDAVGGGHLRAPVDDNLRETCFANSNRFFERYAERVRNVEPDRCTGLLWSGAHDDAALLRWSDSDNATEDDDTSPATVDLADDVLQGRLRRGVLHGVLHVPATVDERAADCSCGSAGG